MYLNLKEGSCWPTLSMSPSLHRPLRCRWMYDYKICTEPGICGYVCELYIVSVIYCDVWSKMFQQHTSKAIFASYHRSSVGNTVFLLMVSFIFHPNISSTISSLTLERILTCVITLLPHLLADIAHVEENVSAFA